jgi:hypothetical protein
VVASPGMAGRPRMTYVKRNGQPAKPAWPVFATQCVYAAGALPVGKCCRGRLASAPQAATKGFEKTFGFVQYSGACEYFGPGSSAERKHFRMAVRNRLVARPVSGTDVRRRNRPCLPLPIPTMMITRGPPQRNKAAVNIEHRCHCRVGVTGAGRSISGRRRHHAGRLDRSDVRARSIGDGASIPS